MKFTKLSEIKGEEEAWDVVAELIDPIADIATDEKIRLALTGEAKLDKKAAAKYVVKAHKKEATKILALLSGQDYDTFKATITPADIFLGVITVLNDRELIDLFSRRAR